MRTSRYFPNRQALTTWFESSGLPAQALTTIERLRDSDPERRPKGPNNVKGFYSSAKNGCAIGYESHTNELPTGLEFEYDPDVVEYHSQKGKVKLIYLDATGKKVGVLTTPDFFVLRRNGAGFVECKTEDKLVELAESMPNRYVRQADGSWRCPPGEDAAAKLGLTYEIRSSAGINRVLTRNLQFFDDYFRRDYPALGAKVVDALRTAVKESQGICYADLAAQLDGKVSVDNLNYAIATGVVYADYGKTLMVDQRELKIFTDSALAAIHAAEGAPAEPVGAGLAPVTVAPTAKVVMNRVVHTIIDVTPDVVTLRTDAGAKSYHKPSDFDQRVASGQIRGFAAPDKVAAEIQKRIATAEPWMMEVALVRWQKIQPLLLPKKKGAKARSVPRSVRRWLASYRKALENYGNGFIGLFPKPLTGNTEPKLEPAVIELMNEFIIKKLETKENRSASHVHGQFRLECEKRDLLCPSLNTFMAHVRSRPVAEHVEKTLGPRPGEKRRKFIYFLDSTSPVHGDRPWEICHIDHTQLDIEVVCSQTGQNLGRPWFTILVDAFTRRILAISVSFSPPSSVSCMKVLRNCVKRHNRLPHFLVVDNGKEFESVYFEALLANFSLHKKSRPPGRPRYGSFLERIFGTVNTRFLHNLLGNTQLMKNAREVTKSVDPKRSARWTLEALTYELSRFCFEVYDTVEHPLHGLTPREAYAQGMELYGKRSHTLIAYNYLFEVLTLPTTKSGRAKVHHQKGVHINYLDYWCRELESPGLHGQSVPVRYDPDNAMEAHVFVCGEWRVCISRNAYEFMGRTTRSIEMAAEELRKQKSAHAKKRSLTAHQIAVYMKEVAETEAVLQERARELASRAACRLLMGENVVMSSASPAAGPTSPSNVEKFPDQKPPVESGRGLPADVDEECTVTVEE